MNRCTECDDLRRRMKQAIVVIEALRERVNRYESGGKPPPEQSAGGAGAGEKWMPEGGSESVSLRQAVAELECDLAERTALCEQLQERVKFMEQRQLQYLADPTAPQRPAAPTKPGEQAAGVHAAPTAGGTSAVNKVLVRAAAGTHFGAVVVEPMESSAILHRELRIGDGSDTICGFQKSERLCLVQTRGGEIVADLYAAPWDMSPSISLQHHHGCFVRVQPEYFAFEVFGLLICSNERLRKPGVEPDMRLRCRQAQFDNYALAFRKAGLLQGSHRSSKVFISDDVHTIGIVAEAGGAARNRRTSSDSEATSSSGRNGRNRRTSSNSEATSSSVTSGRSGTTVSEESPASSPATVSSPGTGRGVLSSSSSSSRPVSGRPQAAPGRRRPSPTSSGSSSVSSGRSGTTESSADDRAPPPKPRQKSKNSKR